RLAPVDELGEPRVVVPAVTRHGLPERVRGSLVRGLHRRLQRLEHVRVRLVRLAALAELHVARILEPRPLRGPGLGAAERLGLELGETDPSDGGRRPGERGRYELVV